MPAKTIEDLYDVLNKRDANQPEFCQAVKEVIESLRPLFEKEPKYIPIMERMMEPERIIIFKVMWENDAGEMQINRAFRVQYNSAIGPYKGGIRFHPSVNLSVLKFLGFEQILKNSLTGLPMGGGKGGSDFDPKGKSDNEIRRFCQSFMTELYRHIGPDTDVPAGDIGVNATCIGYMFGQYKRIKNEWTGVLTGKGRSYGGSLVRPEATGFGAIYYLNEVVNWNHDKLAGKHVLVSGAGNVAQYACKKLIQLGAKCHSLSDSTGVIIEPEGFTMDQLKIMQEIKEVKKGRCSDYLEYSKTAIYYEGKKPWDVYEGDVDCVVPCATQNELNEAQAQRMVEHKVKYVVEGANMPCTNEAVDYFHSKGVFYAPGKASNAGGVSVSGLEMSQNSMRYFWTADEVDAKLQQIMKDIFAACRDTAERVGHPGNFQMGANIAGFLKVADAMIAQGI